MLILEDFSPIDSCDCMEFVWNDEWATPGEEICVCGHGADEHLPSGECGFGVLE